MKARPVNYNGFVRFIKKGQSLGFYKNRSITWGYCYNAHTKEDAYYTYVLGKCYYFKWAVNAIDLFEKMCKKYDI